MATMPFRISGETALQQLQEKWDFPESQAERLLAVARDIGPKSLPVTDGYVTVTYQVQSRTSEDGAHLYTIEKFTAEKVAPHDLLRYTHKSSPVNVPKRRKQTMPPTRARAATAVAEPEVAETEAEAGPPDLTPYLVKEYSPTMNDYLDWFIQEFGALDQIDPERLVVMGSQMYPHFQKSDINISRKAARKAERDKAAESNGHGEAETEAVAAPARTAKPAAPKPAAPRRGRGKPAAAATAAY